MYNLCTVWRIMNNNPRTQHRTQDYYLWKPWLSLNAYSFPPQTHNPQICIKHSPLFAYFLSLNPMCMYFQTKVIMSLRDWFQCTNDSPFPGAQSLSPLTLLGELNGAPEQYESLAHFCDLRQRSWSKLAIIGNSPRKFLGGGKSKIGRIWVDKNEKEGNFFLAALSLCCCARAFSSCGE